MFKHPVYLHLSSNEDLLCSHLRTNICILTHKGGFIGIFKCPAAEYRRRSRGLCWLTGVSLSAAKKHTSPPFPKIRARYLSVYFFLSSACTFLYCSTLSQPLCSSTPSSVKLTVTTETEAQKKIFKIDNNLKVLYLKWNSRFGDISKTLKRIRMQRMLCK